jgi:hypothetical protein
LQDCDSSTDGSPTSSDSKGAAGGAKGQAKLSQRFKGSLNSPADLLAFKVEVVTSTAMSIKGKALYTSLKQNSLPMTIWDRVVLLQYHTPHLPIEICRNAEQTCWVALLIVVSSQQMVIQ